MWAERAAVRTFTQRRFPAGAGQGPDEESVQDERRVVLPSREGPQRPDEKQVQPQGGLPLLGEALCRLADRRQGRPPGVVAGQPRAKCVQRLGLDDGVELAARGGITGRLRIAGQ